MNQIEVNKRNAWLHFWPEGGGKARKGYNLHHVDDTLRHQNVDRYNEWRIADLEMLSISEHTKRHKLGVPFSASHKKKIREALAGHEVSEETRMKISNSKKGCHQSEESNRRRSATLKGIPKSEETKRKISETKRKNNEAKRLMEAIHAEA